VGEELTAPHRRRVHDALWLTLLACLLGAAVPVAYFGPAPLDTPFAWLVTGLSLVPYLLVGGTAWVARRDRQASVALAVVAVTNLLIGLAGWAWAFADREGGALLIVPFGIPLAQLLAWLAGAVVAGRRG
jgi:hypothetical protein